MTLAMLMVGLLFGIALSVTIALFAVLSMGGHFRENLKATGMELQGLVTGRHRKGRSPAPVRPIENDTRVRALQEEVRVMQRLMDQARAERDSHLEEIRKAGEEILSLRAVTAERDELLTNLETALRDETASAGKARDDLVERTAQLARSRQEVKDLETELSVIQSGAGMSAISNEVARLSAERDELTARLDRMTRPVVIAK